MTAAQETRLLRATPGGRALCYERVDAVREARSELERTKRNYVEVMRANTSEAIRSYWFEECLFRAQMLGMATAHLNRAMRAELP